MNVNFESCARRCYEYQTNNDHDSLLQIVTEIRDNIEVIHTGEYSHFLQFLFPVFYNILRQANVQFSAGNNVEQKIRNTILEILNKLPNNDLLKPHVQNLLQLSMYLLEIDNEDNAIICLRIIMELHKNYRPNLEAEVQPFLNIVMKIYQDLAMTTEKVFRQPPPAANTTPTPLITSPTNISNTVTTSTSGTSPPLPNSTGTPTTTATATATTAGTPAHTPLIPSIQSFKVLSECPIIVVLLFQLYPSSVPNNVSKFIPLIISTLGLSPPPGAATTHHQLYVDFISAQVKTLSFLAYILKQYIDLIRPHGDEFPKYVIGLLQNCPSQSAATRKELLIATRYILSSELKVKFIAHLDTLLDERVLMGTSRTGFEALRYIAYSSLADFIHHLRGELSLIQVAKVVALYSKHLHDPTNPFGIQAISARLLISIVEYIPRKVDPDFKARQIVYKIFESLINKFVSLKKQIPKILQTAANPTPDESGDRPSASDTAAGLAPVINDPVKDCRGLIRVVVIGIRNITWALNSCPQFRNIVQPNGQQAQVRIGLAQVDESLMYIKMFKNVIKCMPIYGGVAPAPQDEKDILEHFTQTLNMLEYRTFQELFQAVTPFLYERSIDDQTILNIPQTFLSSTPNTNNNPSKVFAEILAPFLNEKLKSLTPQDKPDPSLITMLKLLFGSIQVNDVESAIQSILSSLILTTVKLATESKHTDSLNYFMLLKIIFRSCNKPELTKDITILFPGILETLNELLYSSYSHEMKLLFVELALTVPIRITSYMPCINLLVRPLIMSLQSTSSELLSIAFKTLEYLVDNVTGDYLLQVFKENKTEFLHSIWIHLRPIPYVYGHHAVRVLGKMAGKSRSITVLSSTPLLTPPPTDVDVVRMLVPFEGQSSTISIPIDKTIDAARNVLMQSSSEPALQSHAFTVLKSCISIYLNTSTTTPGQSLNMDQLASQIQSNLTKFKESGSQINFNSVLDNCVNPGAPSASLGLSSSSGGLSNSQSIATFKTKEDYLEEVRLVKSIITSLLLATSSDHLKTDAKDYTTKLATHFLLLIAVKGIDYQISPSTELNPRLFLDALIDYLTLRTGEQGKPYTLTDEHTAILDTIVKYSSQLYNCTHLSDSVQMVDSNPILRYLIEQFVHMCHQHTPGEKTGGVIGIHYLTKNGYQWIKPFEAMMVKGLMSVVDDSAFMTFQPLIEYTESVLVLLIKFCTPVLEIQEGMDIDTPTTTTTTIKESTITSPPTTSVETPSTTTATSEGSDGQANTSTEINQTPMNVSTPSSPPVPTTPVQPNTSTSGVNPTTSTAATNPTAAGTTAPNPAITGSTPVTVPNIPPPPPPAPLKPHARLSQLVGDNERKVFKEVVECLYKLLFSAQTHTRKVAQKAVNLISEISNLPLHLMLEDVRTFFVKSLPRSLKTLSFQAQTGVMEALVFCLAAPVSLIPFTPETIKFMGDCINVASEEPTHQIKANSQRTMAIITALRLSGVEMATTAMSCWEFINHDSADLKNRMIKTFFKAVTTRNKEISSIAKKGLMLSIAHQKLLKDLLQPCLRPVLSNLTDPKNLSVSFLQGLSRLLELLSNCFNSALGDKLFEYLKKFEDTGKLTQTANRIKECDEVRICAAIIDTFHLLPAASKLLEPTIAYTLKLEQLLCREVSSPYRQPLVRFMAKYAQRAIEIFMSQQTLQSPQYCSMFRLILQNEPVLARPIIEELATNRGWFDTLVKLPEYTSHALSILSSIVDAMPTWIGDKKPIIDQLIELWQNPNRVAQIQLVDVVNANVPAQTQPITIRDPYTALNNSILLCESRVIVKCFLVYLRVHPEETDLLFHLLTAFTVRGSMDFSFLKDFYQNEVAEKSNLEQKKMILTAFLQFFKKPTTTPDLKVHAIQNIATPILQSYFSLPQPQKTMESVVFMELCKQMLEAEMPHEELLLIELLQLQTMLVNNMSVELMDLRKEIIKFAWNHFKNEDFTCRQSAYVLACRFIEKYDTPPKIVLQVYVQLLKAYQVEAKHLVKQALDILVPVLRIRLPGDLKNSTWIKWTKKIIVEEGHSMQQLVHILQLIVRHPQLFYPSRSQFIPHMVTLLPKLGLISNTAVENKKLSVDLTELILNWEKSRITNTGQPNVANTTTVTTASTPSTQSMDVTTPGQGINTPINEPTPTPMTPAAFPSSSDDEYKPPANVIEHILLFLIRMAMTDSKNTPLVDKCCDLLKNALTIWPEANIKFAVFEKPLNSDQVFLLSTMISIINIIVEHQPSFITTNIVQLQQGLVSSISQDNQRLSQLLCQLFKKILTSFPPVKTQQPITSITASTTTTPAPATTPSTTTTDKMQIDTPVSTGSTTTNSSDITPFYTSITTLIGGILEQFEKNYNLSVISLVQIFKEENPDSIDTYLPSLIKIIQKLTGSILAPSEHSIPPSGQQNKPPQANAPATAVAGITTPTASATPTVAGQPPQPVGAQAKQAAVQPGQQQPGQQPPPPAKRPDKEISQTLIKCFNLVKSKVSKLTPDTRKVYTSALFVLVDKSSDIELLTEILNILTQLIMAKELTKEKVSFIQKMMKFIHLDNNKELLNQYFNLVYNVYNDPSSSSKTELSQMENAFMLGLRCSDAKIRGDLFEILHKSIVTQPYPRLNYIIGVQQWDLIGNSYWIRHALELLMSIFPTQRFISLATTTAKFTPLPHHQASANQKPIAMETGDLQEKLKELNDSSLKSLQFGELFSGLREMLFADQNLCHFMWISVFSAVWGKLPKEEHYKLSKTMTTLLTKDYKKIAINSANVALSQQQIQQQQQQQQPSIKNGHVIINIPPTTTESNAIVKSLLDSVSKCQPILKIPAEIVSYLGETYSDHYTAIKMLESHLLDGNKTPEQVDPVWDSLASLYTSLNEKDLQYALQRKRFGNDETKLGLLLEQFYMWQSAQEVYLAAMNKYSSNGAKATTKNENILWEDHWIECGKRLNQWEVLGEYAKSQGMNELFVECAWKQSTPQAIIAMREGLGKIGTSDASALRKIQQGYALIHDKKYSEVDGIIVTSNQLILRRWVNLPLRAARSHTQELIEMQQVVELQEAVHLLKEVAVAQQQAQLTPLTGPARNVLINALNDVRTIFTQWRERLPSKDEDTGVWNEILTWRQQVFQLIGQGVEQISDTVQSTNSNQAMQPKPIVQPETAWTMNKYAHVARKQHIVEVCLNSLSKMFNLQFEVQDIFLNLKEQIKCYLQLPTHYETGISIINGTNLDFFAPLQKSEFFQLKGEFQSRLRLNNDANINFSTAIHLYDNYAKNWIRWGYYCDNQFTNDTSLDPETKASWAESAINCYIQGIRCDPKHAVKLIPRVLWLLYLNNSGEVPQILPQQPSASTTATSATAANPAPSTTTTTATGTTAATTPPVESTPQQPPVSEPPKKLTLAQMVFTSIERTWSILPQWIWLNYIPVLISGAYMSAQFPGYGFLCWQLLSKICYLYPNTTYYHFRKLVSDMKNNINSPHFIPVQQTQLSATGTPLPFPSPLKMAETLSIGLQPYHSSLISEIDTMLNGFISIANTVPAYHHFISSLQYILMESFKVTTSDEIPHNIREMITQSHHHFFEPSTPTSRYPKHGELIEQLRQPFENDFGWILTSKMDTTSTTPRTLSSLINKLVEWVQRKPDSILVTTTPQETINGNAVSVYTHNSTIHLENIAPPLSEFQPKMIELPNQFGASRDPTTDYFIRIEKIGPKVQMVRNSLGMLCPRVQIYANNGRVYPFIIDITPQFLAVKQPLRATERRTQFLSSVNTLLLKYRETRRRGINMNNYPISIPITPAITLIQSLGGRELTPLLDVWSTLNPESELYSPLIMYRNKLLGPMSSVSPVTNSIVTSTTTSPTSEGISVTLNAPTPKVEKSHKQPTKLQAFREISKYMTDGLMTTYINRGLQSYQDQYEFKINFATQWGLHSILSYILFSRIASLSPSDIYFSKSSGSVFFGKWASDLCSENTEFTENGTVPFRLTQNIRNYLNPVFIEGGYQSSLLATSMCLSEMKDQLVNLLCIYIFDEMLCGHIVEPITKTHNNQHVHRELVERTSKIVEKMVVTRLNSITPSIQPDKTLFLTPILKRITELTQLASNSSNISQMETISYPWL